MAIALKQGKPENKNSFDTNRIYCFERVYDGKADRTTAGVCYWFRYDPECEHWRALTKKGWTTASPSSLLSTTFWRYRHTRTTDTPPPPHIKPWFPVGVVWDSRRSNCKDPMNYKGEGMEVTTPVIYRKSHGSQTGRITHTRPNSTEEDKAALLYAARYLWDRGRLSEMHRQQVDITVNTDFAELEKRVAGLTQPTEEREMSMTKVEFGVAIINGQPEANVSDSELIGLIQQEQLMLERTKELPKGAFRKAQKAQIQAVIDGLTTILNTRTPKYGK